MVTSKIKKMKKAYEHTAGKASSEKAANVFAGIDGGGTKTDISVIGEEGKIIFAKTYGSSSLTSGQEFEKRLENILEDLFVRIKDVYNSEVTVNLYGGFAGFSSSDAKIRFNNVFNKISSKYAIKSGIINICPDALLTLNIYFTDRPGLLLISGTGSVCFGKDAEGHVFRTGGFGYLIDDSGSGFWFGKNALKAALRSFYGYGPKTVLESMVREYFSVKDLDQLPGYIYKENSKNKISSASRLVFEAAQTGCNTAEAIIDKGADALALLAKDCSKMMRLTDRNLVLHGSLFKQEVLISKMIKKLPEGTKISLGNKKIDLEAARIILKEF